MSILKKFGHRLKEIRNNKSLSQEKLASIAGLHRTYISDIERGNKNVSLQNIEKLSKALKVKVSDFF
ncbi:helix-turn-helix transcriptional regulator [Candidatus Parcubacteria bacterium]|nr:helix-turn-helix transcriptional regulator [Candidatus Parcubacteria bacterium]